MDVRDRGGRVVEPGNNPPSFEIIWGRIFPAKIFGQTADHRLPQAPSPVFESPRFVGGRGARPEKFFWLFLLLYLVLILL